VELVNLSPRQVLSTAAAVALHVVEDEVGSGRVDRDIFLSDFVTLGLDIFGDSYLIAVLVVYRALNILQVREEVVLAWINKAATASTQGGGEV